LFFITPAFGSQFLQSFQNSPDGFRCVKWGYPPTAIDSYSLERAEKILYRLP